MAFSQYTSTSRNGFTLIEVVLALGIFLISILALIGLLAPMLESVDKVEQIDEITSVVNTVGAFLQNSPEIALRNTDGTIAVTKFNAIYEAMNSTNGDEATIFVYRYYDDSSTTASKQPVRLEIGFSPDDGSSGDGQLMGNAAIINEPSSNPADYTKAAGPIYRVVLTASPVIPIEFRSDSRNARGIYTLLLDDPDEYPEGSLALEVRIFAEEPPGPNGFFDTTTNLAELNRSEPDFTFNSAIVR